MESLQDINPVERALVNKANQNHVPITANFELTPTCTLNCDMCFIHTERNVVERHGGLLPLQQWLDWAEQLQDMGTLFILLTGGEPMLYPHFKELYTRLREMGFILTLNTNGTLIDNEMVRILQTHKPRRINVTLYGSSRETYGRLCHNPQGYTLCVEALKRLKKAGIDVKLNEARSRAGEAQWRVTNIPRQQQQMLSIERQQRIKEELYLYLLNKREENALSQATTETDARVLDPAGGGDAPISPNGRSMIMAGVMKGIALPAIVLLLFLFFDTRIRNRKDIEDAVTVPFLGEIPKDSSKGKTENKETAHGIAVRAQGRDIVSEAFRIIRTNMDFYACQVKEHASRHFQLVRTGCRQDIRIQQSGSQLRANRQEGHPD